MRRKFPHAANVVPKEREDGTLVLMFLQNDDEKELNVNT